MLKNWKIFVTVLTPLLLSGILIFWDPKDHGSTQKEPYGAYVILLMGIYWMTECIPIPITSLIPVLLFPIFGIVSSDKVTCVYLQESFLFLLGGCIIALSFEYSNLHSRIALKVIMLMGAHVSQLLFGIMLTTMILSMWMNNTSTTAMMVPIVNALTDEIRIKMLQSNTRRRSRALSGDDGVIEISMERIRESFRPVHSESVRAEEIIKNQNVESLVQRMRIMFLLGTAFASNIGGTGVITGSGTNLIALELIRKKSEELNTPIECRPFLEISFVNWMLFNIPPMLLNTLIVYFYLQIHFIGLPSKWLFWKQKENESVKNEAQRAKILEQSIRNTIGQKYEELGPMKFNEWIVMTCFITIVSLWVFKNPQIIPGWDTLFQKTATGGSYVKESTPTFLVASLLFILPSKSKYFVNIKQGSLGSGMKDPVLTWSFVKEKMPWGVFILLGGGAAMALGAKESGLNKWLESVLQSNETLNSLPNSMLLLIIMILVAIMTTLASNTAVAAILTPVLLEISNVKTLHPLFLVLPATTVSSYAFILPVSTPPNAIVYSSCDDLKLKNMALPGLIINVLSIFVLILTTLTTGTWLLNFNSYNGQCLSSST